MFTPFHAINHLLVRKKCDLQLIKVCLLDQWTNTFLNYCLNILFRYLIFLDWYSEIENQPETALLDNLPASPSINSCNCTFVYFTSLFFNQFIQVTWPCPCISKIKAIIILYLFFLHDSDLFTEQMRQLYPNLNKNFIFESDNQKTLAVLWSV